MFEVRRLDRDSATQLAHWCGGILVEEIDAIDNNERSPGINVPCKNGVQRASLGDYIGRDDDGSFVILNPSEVGFKFSDK